MNAPKTAKYGDKSLRTLSPHFWNSFPKHINTETISQNSRNKYTSGLDQPADAIYLPLKITLANELEYALGFDPLKTVLKCFYVFNFSFYICVTILYFRKTQGVC